MVARATEFFGAEPMGYIVLVRRPDDEDIERAALAAGFRAGWTERPMALTSPPSASTVPDEVEVRVVADRAGVVDYGRVVALANDDPVSASGRRCCFTTRRSSLLTSPRSSRTWELSQSPAR